MTLLMICVLFGVGLASAKPPPNIIVIVADDLGWNDVSFHGSSQIPTPNIDKLARDGITLNNYYVQPICTPTRAALLTGRHPIHTGMQHGVLYGSAPYGLPLSEKLLPQYLKELGYANHMVGKWHLGFFKKEYLPTYRGFDSHFGYWLGCEDYFDHTSEASGKEWGHDFHRDLTPLTNYTNIYSTDIYAKEAVNIIHSHNKSQPLFLYLPHQAVHSGNVDGEPLQAPQHYIDRHRDINNVNRRIFAGMVSALDDAVGDVTKALTDAGMMDNSIIVFTTDNGGPSNGFDANAASNWPLRGVKATYWEGGVRGVGFVHSPLINQSYISEQKIQVIDWLPTLVTAAGGRVDDPNHLDGIDMWAMLSSNGAEIRTEILHNIDPYFHNNAAIRVGDFKLVTGKQLYANWDGWYPPWQEKGDKLNVEGDRISAKADYKEFSDLDMCGHNCKTVTKSDDGDSSDSDSIGADFSSDSNDPDSNPDFNRDFDTPDKSVDDSAASHRSDSNDVGNVAQMDQFWAIVRKKHDLTKSTKASFLRKIRKNNDKTEITSNEQENNLKFVNKGNLGLNNEHHGCNFKHTVKCGKKPLNASITCHPTVSPCLFHIPSDPCEYTNIADRYPSIVDSLLTRIAFYRKTMIPPGNLPVDPRGFPKYHNGYWVPWL